MHGAEDACRGPDAEELGCEDPLCGRKWIIDINDATVLVEKLDHLANDLLGATGELEGDVHRLVAVGYAVELGVCSDVVVEVTADVGVELAARAPEREAVLVAEVADDLVDNGGEGVGVENASGDRPRERIRDRREVGGDGACGRNRDSERSRRNGGIVRAAGVDCTNGRVGSCISRGS
jgi:hypothetical protein